MDDSIIVCVSCLLLELIFFLLFLTQHRCLYIYYVYFLTKDKFIDGTKKFHQNDIKVYYGNWQLFSRLFWNKNVIFFSVILNIPLFEFRILHIFHLFQLLVLKRPQTKFKIHHVQAIYPSVSSINESKELFWKSRNSPFCCWYVSGDQKWIFIADTDVAAVVKTRFFLKQKIYTHYILIANCNIKMEIIEV